MSSADGFVPAAFVPLQSEHSRITDLNGGCQPIGRAPCRVLASLSLERVLEHRRCDTNGVPGRDSQDGFRKSGLGPLGGTYPYGMTGQRGTEVSCRAILRSMAFIAMTGRMPTMTMKSAGKAASSSNSSLANWYTYVASVS